MSICLHTEILSGLKLLNIFYIQYIMDYSENIHKLTVSFWSIHYYYKTGTITVHYRGKAKAKVVVAVSWGIELLQFLARQGN